MFEFNMTKIVVKKYNYFSEKKNYYKILLNSLILIDNTHLTRRS